MFIVFLANISQKEFMNNNKTAKIGENIVCRHLESKNYRICFRNVKFREGEIDIIAELNGLLIFIEVKTRTNWHFGYPEDSFNLLKKSRMEAAINKYMFNNNYSGDWRADLIVIDIKGKKAELRHYVGVELD